MTPRHLPLDGSKAVGEATRSELMESLDEIRLLTLDQGNLLEMAERVSEIAVRSIQGCDAAGLTLMTDGNPTTAGATDELVERADRAQYETEEGPCLHAIRDDKIYRIASMESEERFPAWAPMAREAGVMSVLSVPLRVRGRVTGAMNLYSRHEHGFVEEDEASGELVAGQAAVCLLNGQIYDRSITLTKQLATALETRREIGIALGILMQREGISDLDAFTMLKNASQKSNTKLNAVARKVVAGHEDGLTH